MTNEIVACTTVLNKYKKGLDTGEVDPDTVFEQMKEELAGQLSPILDETEAWLSIRAAIRGTAAEPHIRQERSLQV